MYAAASNLAWAVATNMASGGSLIWPVDSLYNGQAAALAKLEAAVLAKLEATSWSC